MSKKSIVVTKVCEGHDNPIAELVQVACKFDSEITLESDNRKINAKSIMAVSYTHLKVSVTLRCAVRACRQALNHLLY